MSDFYQILKREVEADDNLSELAPSEERTNTTDTAVEKFIIEKNKSFIKTIKRKKQTGRPKIKKIISEYKKPIRKKSSAQAETFLSSEIKNPVYLTMSETAKLGGVKKITIKRALRSSQLKYRIVDKRYQVNLRSALLYFRSKRKLWNKLNEEGLGQYVERWKN